MIYVAHRGNTNGRSADENKPSYVDRALECFNAEVDVWSHSGLYLGHDEPTYKINIGWLIERRDLLWIHCKNLKALSVLLKVKQLNVFWHQQDDYALTSKGYIWTAKESSGPRVVVVTDKPIYKAYGICSNFVGALPQLPFGAHYILLV